MSRALLLLALVSCRVDPNEADANFSGSDDTPIGFSLLAPACAVLESGATLAVGYQSLEAAELTVELHEGTAVTALVRRHVDAKESGTFDVRADALGAAVLHVWVHARGRASQAFALPIDRRAVVPGASATDADGDCYPPRLGDCNDAAASVSPASEEVCDRADNDCDGTVDEGCDCDDDNDGAVATRCGGMDCDDGRVDIRPGATELCDGIDNDCDGELDESFDADGDGFVFCPGGTLEIVRQRSGAACPPGFSFCADCDDTLATTYPGGPVSCPP